jgi:hypothetical protein
MSAGKSCLGPYMKGVTPYLKRAIEKREPAFEFEITPPDVS